MRPRHCAQGSPNLSGGRLNGPKSNLTFRVDRGRNRPPHHHRVRPADDSVFTTARIYQSYCINRNPVQAEVDAPTTVTLPTSVRRRLRDYQVGGKSVADAISDLMDEVPPDYFRRDMQKAMEMGPRLSLQEFRRRHRIPGN